jgi:hypothetical protein
MYGFTPVEVSIPNGTVTKNAGERHVWSTNVQCTEHIVDLGADIADYSETGWAALTL